MSGAFILTGLLTIPVFLYRAETFHRGLLTGIFISLFSLGSGGLLSLVPLAAASGLSLACKKTSKGKTAAVPVKNRSLPFFIAFVLALSVCYFSYQGIAPCFFLMAGKGENVVYPVFLRILACIFGPLSLGLWLDRDGPFPPALFLCFSYIVAIWLTAMGLASHSPYLLGRCLADFSVSGFFTVMPALVIACFGESSFIRVYAKGAFAALSGLFISGLITKKTGAAILSRENPAIFLIFMSALSLWFLHLAWKKRVMALPPSEAVRLSSAEK